MNVASTVVGPGTRPVRNPTTEPRAIGAADRFHSSRVGRSSRRRTVATWPFRMPDSAISSTSATPYRPMITGTSSIPCESRVEPKVKRRIGRDRVHAHGAQREADRHEHEGVHHRAARQPREEQQACRGHREVFGRTEAERLVGEPGRRQDDADHAEGAGDERADRRHRQRRPGPAPPGHLVAVERRDHRPRLAGDVDQDRGRGAAVHRPVVDAGEHDEGGRRLERERRGQEQGHRAHRPDAGEDAHDGADQHADEAGEQVGRRQRDREAVEQPLERAH